MIGQQANQLVSRVEEGGESETGRCQKCSGDFNASYVQCVTVRRWSTADSLQADSSSRSTDTAVSASPQWQSKALLLPLCPP